MFNRGSEQVWAVAESVRPRNGQKVRPKWDDVSFDIDELRRRLPSAKQIASDLYGVKWHGNRARCARAENHAHGDRNPSFAFLDKKDRLHCFSQLCFGERPIDVFDFVSQMEHCDFYEAATRLNEFYGAGMMRVDPKRGNVAKTLAQLKKDGWEVVAEYSMGDAVRKLRIEHPDRIQLEKGRPEKTFLWEHCAADGKWKPGRGGRPYNAYVNPLFRERDQIESVLGVESERSADAAGAVGFPAFSFKELTAENAVSFAGLAVRLLPDKDVSGQKLIQRSIEFLRPHTRGIEIIEPPEEWPEAGDLYDAIAERGWTEVQIAALLATARPAQRAALQREQRPKSIPVASQAPPELLSVADLLALDVPEAEMLIEGLIPSPGASLLFGAPKSNKTLLAIQMAIAVASGCPLFGCRSVLKPGTVLVVEQDDPAGKSTVKSILQRSSVSVEGIPFHLVPRVPFTFGRELIEWLERKIATLGLVLVVLDSYTALRSPRKSGIDIVKAEQEDLTQLDDLAKRTGSAIVVVHHDSKGSVGMEWSQKAACTFAMSSDI